MIHILGFGPLTNNLGLKLMQNQGVSIYTNQKVTGKLSNVTKSYHLLHYGTLSANDVFLIGWRGYPDQNETNKNLLESLERKLAPSNIVFNLSSVSVYGNTFQPANEQTAPAPINSYGKSKLNLESFLNERLSASVINLRISNMFGDEKFNDVVNAILHSQQSNSSIKLVEPENILRDFISIDTVSNIIFDLLKLNTKESHRSTLNIASGESITISTLIEKIEEFTNSKITYRREAHSPSIIKQSIIENTELIELLNLSKLNQFKNLKDYVVRHTKYNREKF